MGLVDINLTNSILKKNWRNANGARAANIKRNPHGYIYFLKIRNQDLYKIGVSRNPKGRIKDIDSYSPYPIQVICIAEFKNVYNVEEMIFDNLKENIVRREWLKLNTPDAIQIKKEILQFSQEGLILEKR